MNRALRAGARTGIPEVRQAARDRLPKRGGLNEYEADQKINVSVTSGARTAGVRIRGKASQRTDTGTWRHPVPSMLGYDRSYWQWTSQTYSPAEGWWSDTWRAQSVKITPLIVAELNRVGARIQGGYR